MSLLEQNTTRKRWVDADVRQMEFNTDDNNRGKYEVEAIWDSAVYIKEVELGHLPGFYYLVSWKAYLEEENTKKQVLAV